MSESHCKGELTVGVLGGMGPEATIDFMADVLKLTGAGRDQDHIHLIVDQNPKVPNRQEAIRSGRDDVGPALAAMARRLQEAGAVFLVMPCNSAHAFEDSIRDATAVPFVSIIEVCVQALREACAGGKRIALMATDGLVATGLYQRALQSAGFEVLLPDVPEQERLMALIHRIKGGDKQRDVARTLAELGRSLTDRATTGRLGEAIFRQSQRPILFRNLCAGNFRYAIAFRAGSETLQTIAIVPLCQKPDCWMSWAILAKALKTNACCLS
jgi:aspartate racemase